MRLVSLSIRKMQHSLTPGMEPTAPGMKSSQGGRATKLSAARSGFSIGSAPPNKVLVNDETLSITCLMIERSFSSKK